MLHILFVIIARVFALCLLLGLLYYILVMIAMVWAAFTGKDLGDSFDWVTWWSATHHRD